MVNYEPNFNDPRVRRRIEQAITWAYSYVPKNTPKAMSKVRIDKNLGFSGRPLGIFLRKHLIICCDSYFNSITQQCKKYVLNQQGMAYLQQAIGIKEIAVDTSPIDQYADELITGDFAYNEQSSRLHHAIQNQPRVVKRPGLAKYGYCYNYDIVACAPTLLIQYSRKLNLIKATPAIDQYLLNRSAIRDKISADYSIDPQSIKKIINALFQGGRLSHWSQNQLLQELNNDHAKMAALKQDQFICELRRDIKEMWRAITPHMARSYVVTKSGRSQRKPISAREKSELYRQLEIDVIKSVERYLRKHNHLFLLEHDGWTTQQMIDIDGLRTHVRINTGYVITIDWEKYVHH